MFPVALLILGLQLFANYATIFRIFKWLTLALFAYVITAFFAHPQLGQVLKATVVPHIEFTTDYITAIVAILGTTISPVPVLLAGVIRGGRNEGRWIDDPVAASRRQTE